MTDQEAQEYIDSIPEMDCTPVNDLILQVLVKLRNDHPELDLNQKQHIRDALWKAWSIAYRIEYCID
jgi:hypothetical protein